MKFINQKSVWLILSFIAFSFQANALSTAFDKPVPKDSAEQAYQILLKADLFALGGTGYAGKISDGEKALKILLNDEESFANLKNLVKDATPEGGLYALLGLRMLKCDCFEEEARTFLNKPEPGERIIWGNRKLEAGMISRMSGCIAFSEKRDDVAEKIKTGKFDFWIKSEELRRELKKQKN